MFLSAGENWSRSSGIQRSANLGKLLYTSPASSPATKAPETRVRNTRALQEITIFLRLAMAGVTFAGSIVKKGKRTKMVVNLRTVKK